MPKKLKPCLATGLISDDHRRATCPGCQAAYAKRWRESPSGRSYLTWYAGMRHGSPMARAHKAITRAIRAGKIDPPSTWTCPCGDPAAVYHCHDYARPLEVIAVCHKCKKAFGNPKGYEPLPSPGTAKDTQKAI